MSPSNGNYVMTDTVRITGVKSLHTFRLENHHAYAIFIAHVMVIMESL